MDAVQKSELSGGVVVDKNVLSLFLDTQYLQNSIKLWLEGKVKVQKNEKGYMNIEEQSYGKELANKQGVHELVGWVATIVNEHTLQAAFENRSEYISFMQNLNLELAEMIFVNGDDWGMSPSNFGYVCDTLINMVGLALSRTIGDKERGRYIGLFGQQSKEVVYTSNKRERPKVSV